MNSPNLNPGEYRIRGFMQDHV